MPTQRGISSLKPARGQLQLQPVQRLHGYVQGCASGPFIWRRNYHQDITGGQPLQASDVRVGTK